MNDSNESNIDGNSNNSSNGQSPPAGTVIKPGAWALVTGASSGIGYSLATKLAGRGMNLVLVARGQERLEELAAQLPVETEVLVADLSKASHRKLVAERLRSDTNPIDLLVNNAGIWSFSPFAETKSQDLNQMISVNLLALVNFTHAAVPRMRDQGHGAVLNISSIAGFLPLPFEATYGATKAFVNSFSQGLYAELKGTGVHVCAVCPGVTRTELHERANGMDHVNGLPDAAWMSAAEVADISIKAVERGTALCVPGGVNKVMSAFLDVVPTPTARWVAAKVNRMRRN